MAGKMLTLLCTCILHILNQIVAVEQFSALFKALLMHNTELLLLAGTLGTCGIWQKHVTKRVQRKSCLKDSTVFGMICQVRKTRCAKQQAHQACLHFLLIHLALLTVYLSAVIQLCVSCHQIASLSSLHADKCTKHLPRFPFREGLAYDT